MNRNLQNTAEAVADLADGERATCTSWVRYPVAGGDRPPCPRSDHQAGQCGAGVPRRVWCGIIRSSCALVAAQVLHCRQ